jgi:hypothetical protein
MNAQSDSAEQNGNHPQTPRNQRDDYESRTGHN